MSRPRVGPAVGVGLIWAFLILFLIYPLGRIFYDAVTDEAGRWTLANFREFFTDRFYLRSLVNSMILGVVTVFSASVLASRWPTCWCATTSRAATSSATSP